MISGKQFLSVRNEREGIGIISHPTVPSVSVLWQGVLRGVWKVVVKVDERRIYIRTLGRISFPREKLKGQL